MHFMLRLTDKPDHAQVRQDNRPAHLEYLKANVEKIVWGGPMISDDGTATKGSLLIVDMADRAAAEAFAAGDPYAKAGLFAEVEITAVRQVLPAQ